MVSSDGTPSVRHVRTFSSGTNKCYYERHAFSADDTKVFFMRTFVAAMSADAIVCLLVRSSHTRASSISRPTESFWNVFSTLFPSDPTKLLYILTAGTSSPWHFECDLWTSRPMDPPSTDSRS